MDRMRGNVDALAGQHLALDERLAFLNFEQQLPRPEENRFVLHVVVLQAQRMAGLDVQYLPHIACGLRPVQLVTPRLVDFSDAQESTGVSARRRAIARSRARFRVSGRERPPGAARACPSPE